MPGKRALTKCAERAYNISSFPRSYYLWIVTCFARYKIVNLQTNQCSAFYLPFATTNYRAWLYSNTNWPILIMFKHISSSPKINHLNMARPNWILCITFRTTVAIKVNKNLNGKQWHTSISLCLMEFNYPDTMFTRVCHLQALQIIEKLHSMVSVFLRFWQIETPPTLIL